MMKHVYWQHTYRSKYFLLRQMITYPESKQEVLGRNNRLFSFDMTRAAIENSAPNDSSIVACVFIAAVTFLPSRCLATIGCHTYV
jgi:hypothetical protein